MASVSAVALLVGDGTLVAIAAPCNHTISSSFDNPFGNTTANVCVLNTSFTGNITNEGTISPSGIAFQNGTIAGFVSSTGTINGGISLDVASRITSSGIGILISGPLTGGISNAGHISGTSRGIVVTSMAQFGSTSAGGGIINSGTISSGGNGIVLHNITDVAGGIANSGTIVANSNGIVIGSISRFAGGIQNSGTISLATTGVAVGGVTSFLGGMTNTGTISAGHAGLSAVTVSTFTGGITNTANITVGLAGLSAVDISGFSGGMTNTGTISAGTGMRAFQISTFMGGMTNTGTISAVKTGISAQNVSVFSGGMTNTGKITAGTSGMYVFQVSTFSGGMTNTGTILVTHVTAMFSIANSTFSGGITNSGTISGGQGAVAVNFNTLFSGGVTNTGSAMGGVAGISVFTVSTFTGAISNSGTITAGALGISVSLVAQFGSTSAGGGIVNSGMISSGGNGIAINAITSFVGGISNNSGGTISATSYGAALNAITVYSGGLLNAGSMTAGNAGFSVGNIATFGGNISNAGTIVAKTGISVLGNVSFAAGSAIVNSGTITGTAAAIDTSAAANPVIIDQQGGSLSGAIKLSASADILNISGGSISGNIVGKGSSDTINFDLGSGTFLYGSAYGFNTIHQVNVVSGTVVLNGSNSASNIAVNGGTLAGIGTLTSPINVNDGGTVAPGLPGVAGGTLNIAGNLVMTSAATFLANVAPSAASLALINGSAASIGGTLDANGTGGAFTSGAKYTVLTASGAVGAFNSLIVTGNFGSMVPTVSYDLHDVYLTLSPGSLPLPSGAAQNVTNVANAITAGNLATPVGGTPPLAFQTLFNLPPQQLLNALNQLSGEVATGTQQATYQAMGMFMGLLTDPLLAGRGNPMASPRTAAQFADDGARPRSRAERDAYAAIYRKAPPIAAPFEQRWNVWAAGYGGSETTSGNAVTGSSAATSRIYGTAVGADYLISPYTLAGFALAGGGTNFSIANGLGSGHSDLFQAGVYAYHTVGAGYITEALAYGWQDVTTNRTVAVAGTDLLQARFRANAFSGRLEGGYRFATSWAGITPYAAGQFVSYDLPSYAEQDLSRSNGFALNDAGKNVTASRSELGLRTDRSWVLDTAILTLRSRLGWAHNFNTDPSISATFQALPGASFVVNGAAQAHDAALTTASAEMTWRNGLTLAATFEGEFSSTTLSYAGKGTLRYRW